MSFYNPYNFIPTPKRKTDDELGDGRPVGHHAYFADKWSGRLDVTMTVETPLLVPGLARDETKPHKVYGTRLGADGLPYLPPTSIKGMLRSAYEAVTNSRFGVLQPHPNRLGYRMATRDAEPLVPVRIDAAGIEVLDGDPKNSAGARRMSAAWLPMYKGKSCKVIGPPPATGEERWAWVELFQHYSRDKVTGNLGEDFQFWQVLVLSATNAGLPTAPPAPSVSTESFDQVNASTRKSWRKPIGSPMERVQGYVLITNENIKSKHDERLFFRAISSMAGATSAIIPWNGRRDELGKRWTDLILSYRGAHRPEDVWQRTVNVNGREVQAKPWQRVSDMPGGPAWSPQIYLDGKEGRQDASELKDRTLCYARIDKATNLVRDLFPVAIARELYNQPPINLIDPWIRPASSLDELSPADRVFGWVRQGTTEKNKNEPAAYRGQLRVSEARCIPPENQSALERFDQPLALAILSKPKPQQGRFYLAADENGTPLNAAGSNAYKADQRIRGRKVYPHQCVPDPTTYWSATPPPGAEHVRTAAPTETSQNRSIESWVRPGTAFAFSVDVVNLSSVELGALIWLLSLEDQHFHRFGGGKPLGFGSVRLALTGASVSNGAFQNACYRHLVKRPEPQNRPLAEDGSKAISSASDPLVREIVASFQKRVEDVYDAPFDRVPFIKAFTRACRGFGPVHPTHYPRPAAGGDNFEWFRHATPLKRIDNDTDPILV